MNTIFEIACTILICIFGYLLFNLYQEVDALDERQRYYEKRLESIYDYTFKDYEEFLGS